MFFNPSTLSCIIRNYLGAFLKQSFPKIDEDSMDIEQQGSSGNQPPSRLHNKNSRAKPNSDVDSDAESRTSTEQSSSMHTEPMDEIEVILKPHPLKELTLTLNRFIKTTSNATVTHLSKYLWTRLTVDATDSQAALSPSSSASSSNAKPSTSATNQSESNISDFLIYFR